MRFRGVLAGALVLVALERITRTNDSADRVGGMLSGVAGLVRRVIDPTVPAIPDLTGATGADPSATVTSWSTVPARTRRRPKKNNEPDDDADSAEDGDSTPRLPAVASV